MKFLFFCSICLCIFGSSVSAQKKRVQINTEKTFVSVKLFKDKPSVYITFEKFGEFTSDKTKETYDIAWFRLHNNFKGDISFCSYDLSVSPTGNIGVHYVIERALDYTNLTTRNNESIPLGFPPYDFCDEYKLKSGKTFLFGVPQSQLTEGTLFKVQFYYPWEDKLDFLTVKEPQHYIYFYAIDLPKK